MQNKEPHATTYDKILIKSKINPDNHIKREHSKHDEADFLEKNEEKNGNDSFTKKGENEYLSVEDKQSKKNIKSFLSSPAHDEKLNLLNDTNETGFLSPKAARMSFQEADFSQRIIKLAQEIPEEVLSSVARSESEKVKNGEEEFIDNNNKSKFFMSDIDPNESGDESKSFRSKVLLE